MDQLWVVMVVLESVTVSSQLTVNLLRELVSAKQSESIKIYVQI